MMTEAATRIGVVGCAGRMGQMLIAAVISSPHAALVGGTERPDHPALGTDPARLISSDTSGLQISDDAEALFRVADVIIDFTVPETTARHAVLAAKTGTPLVIGTTGLDETQDAALSATAATVPILQAANMSLGINILLGLTRQLAGLLDEAYDIEIVEMHHRHKVDAPSGTALALGQEAATGRGVDFNGSAITTRQGQTGQRKTGAIGFATLRGGDVAGEHSVIFAGPGERIELTHKASSRDVFARGAVHAANWLVGQPPGRYTMRDVLGLSDT